MKKTISLGVALAVLGTVTFAPSASAAAKFPGGRVDPCATAATWAQRSAQASHTKTSMEELASSERACAATFTHLDEACPHALRAGEAYTSVGARHESEEAPKTAVTTDFALAFEAYTFAAGACRGSAQATAVRAAAASARHVKAES